MATRKKIFGEWGVGPLPANFDDYKDFYNGWILVVNWKQIEPSAGVFNFSSLQNDMDTLKDAGLNIGITVWINPKVYLPNWLFNAPYNIPIVNATNPTNQYAYYNTTFKQRLQNMHKYLINFLINTKTNSNIIFFQSAEGHEGQPKPYLGSVPSNKNLTDAQFEQWQKDIWSYDYDRATTTNENGTVELIDIVLNAADNDSLKDYILTYLPSAWVKVDKDGSDYGYNLESFDWDEIENVEEEIIADNPGALRKRSDLAFTVNRPWFQQAYGMNQMEVALHAIAKGVDILTINTDNIGNANTHETVSDIINKISGFNSGLGLTKVAWWAANCKIDASDTTRWPINTYGHVLTGGADTTNNNNEYITKANITRLNAIKNAVPGALLDTTQFGQNAGVDTRLNDKFNSDIGMKVKTGPIGKFISQPNYFNEVKFFFRIGSTQNDYWGRYAYGFKATTGTGSKMFFVFDNDFKSDTYGLTVTITHWNGGNCQWGLRNVTGSLVGTVTNTNTQEWKTYTVDINSFKRGQLTNALSQPCDLSLEYVAGNNTVRFAFIEFDKKDIPNVLPTVNAGSDTQITGTSITLTATANDSDGIIVSQLWELISGPIIPVIASPTALSTNITGISANGDYEFQVTVTDDRGGKAYDTITITKVGAIVKPTANAGPDKTITLPTSSVSVGGTDTAPDGFAIASILWSVASKPTGATNPTFTAGTSATTTANGMTVSGDYTLRKTVTDDQSTPQMDDDDVIITVLPASTTTEFGILIAGNDLTGDQKISLMDQFNVNILRTSLVMDGWLSNPNDNMLNKIAQQRKKVALNCNWRRVGRTPQGDKIPNAFPTGNFLTKYLESLDAVCKKYGPDGMDIIEFIVIENEPTTGNFYTGPVEDYIAQVAAAIVVCQSNDIKVADGAVHVPFVLDVKTAEKNSDTLTGKQLMVQKIMNAYTDEWADIDYTNIHSSIGGADGEGNEGSENAAMWKRAFDFMRVKSGGKPIICNEMSVHSLNAVAVDTLTAVLNQHKDSRLAYSIPYDGPNSESSSEGAKPFQIIQMINGITKVTLNGLGVAFENVVSG